MKERGKKGEGKGEESHDNLGPMLQKIMVLRQEINPKKTVLFTIDCHHLKHNQRAPRVQVLQAFAATTAVATTSSTHHYFHFDDCSVK